MIDLHCHTTASDGTLKPDELVRLAAKRSITYLSVTDHDTTDGLTEAARRCAASGIRFIPGIELSTRYKGRAMDVLGYGIDPNCPTLRRALRRLVQARRERIPAIVRRLRRVGVYIDAEDVFEHAGGNVVGRPHIARALAAQGIVRDTAEAFRRYLGREGVAYVPKDVLAYDEAIRLIRTAGGVPVLAHPKFLNVNDDEFRSLLRDLINAGLVGIEVYYSRHDARDVAYYEQRVRKNNLLATGGSDFHGATKPDIDLGAGPSGRPLDERLALNVIAAIEGMQDG